MVSDKLTFKTIFHQVQDQAYQPSPTPRPVKGKANKTHVKLSSEATCVRINLRRFRRASHGNVNSTNNNGRKRTATSTVAVGINQDWTADVRFSERAQTCSLRSLRRLGAISFFCYNRAHRDTLCITHFYCYLLVALWRWTDTRIVTKHSLLFSKFPSDVHHVVYHCAE